MPKYSKSCCDQVFNHRDNFYRHNLKYHRQMEKYAERMLTDVEMSVASNKTKEEVEISVGCQFDNRSKEVLSVTKEGLATHFQTQAIQVERNLKDLVVRKKSLEIIIGKLMQAPAPVPVPVPKGKKVISVEVPQTGLLGALGFKRTLEREVSNSS